MLHWLLPLILIILALVSLVVLVLKKIPQLRVINVESIPKERERRKKHDLIASRLQRQGKQRVDGVSKMVGTAAREVSRVGRRAVQKLYKLEQYYQKLNNAAADEVQDLDDEAVKRLLQEAEDLVREEEYIPAEKTYIKIISHNPRQVDAYEGLGNLYKRNGNLKQARETFQFTLRIAPKDASVHVSLAEIDLAERKYKDAVISLRKAIEIRPKNPKYLDFYIESSLKAKMPEDAKKGIEQLESVNEENQKIAEFKERLKEIEKKQKKDKPLESTEKQSGEKVD